MFIFIKSKSHQFMNSSILWRYNTNEKKYILQTKIIQFKLIFWYRNLKYTIQIKHYTLQIENNTIQSEFLQYKWTMKHFKWKVTQLKILLYKWKFKNFKWKRPFTASTDTSCKSTVEHLCHIEMTSSALKESQ